MEYTVHFQRGTVVGARSLRMVHVDADFPQEAIMLAKREFSQPGYRLIRVDHYDDENACLVIDY